MNRIRWISIALLLAGAVLLGWRLTQDWSGYRALNDPQAIKLRPTPPPAVPASEPAAQDYAVVAQQNPFHPERNDAMPPPPPPAAVAPIGPPPLIYGSMILGKEKFALMAAENDPRPRKVIEGDSFNGYKLAEVKAQSVVLESGGTSNEVMLYNALARVRRGSGATGPPPPPAVPAASAATTVGANPSNEPPATDASHPGQRLVLTPFGRVWMKEK